METNVTHTICEFDHLGVFTVLGELRVNITHYVSIFGVQATDNHCKRAFECMEFRKISI